jgi:hypothetical protein
VQKQKFIAYLTGLAFLFVAIGCSTDSQGTTSELTSGESVASQDTGSMAFNNKAEQTGEDGNSATSKTVGGSGKSVVKEPEALTSEEPVTNHGVGDSSASKEALEPSVQADPASATPEIAEVAASREETAVAADEGDRQVVGESAGASNPVAGDDAPPDTGTSIADYFPLESDRRWEYRVRTTRGGRDLPEATARKFVKGTKQIGGKQYVKVATDFVREVPDQHYRLDARGVFAAVDGAPGEELLILPAKPESTRNWSGSGKPKITEFSGSATVNETCRCGDQVYQDCIKVSLKMTIIIVQEPSLFSRGGEFPVSVRMNRWFAPGLGMVKEEREDGVVRIVSELTGTQP